MERGKITIMVDHAKIPLADDDVDSLKRLVRIRIPPLLIGLFVGFLISFATSRFEEVLKTNVEVAYFIPFVVYMAAAVGAQTQTIYTRDLIDGTARFSTYLAKEMALGIILGALFGLVSWGVVVIWLGSHLLALSVGLAIFAAISAAPLVALTVTEILQLHHQDPAVGAGPIATVIQDTISVVLYGIIASAIMLS